MSNISYTKEDIVGVEPKHITYVAGKNHDVHVVKEIIHLKDKRQIPNIRIWEDYQRPYWITQKGRRNHEEKKDYEFEKYLTKYKSTQLNMPRAIARALEDYKAGPNPRLRQLARSPFLYGADVSSSCYLKNDYQQRYPGLLSRNTVAGGDIETNVYESENDGQIICMSVTHKTKVYLAYLKHWVSDIDDPVADTHRMMAEIPELVTLVRDRKLDIVVEVLNTPADIVIQCMKRLHEWKPDFFGFWNISFDMSRILACLEKYGVDPAQVFSDEKVPNEYKHFHYREDQPIVTTASGVSKSKGPQDQWHWITAPASFQCIDLMSTYRVTRLAKGKEPSYALDYILNKELNARETITVKDVAADLEKFRKSCGKHISSNVGGHANYFVNEKQVPQLEDDKIQVDDVLLMTMEFGKLKFAEAAHLTGIEWHQFMQTKHKIKYGLYNIIDSIRLEQLDEKTNDLARSITLFSKSSDYKNFSSNPRRLCDDMHFWYLKRPEPCVIGTSSDQMVHELDQYVVGHEDWIVTLPSYMAGQHGIKCIKDLPDYPTLIFVHVADLDIVSTYPNVSQILNIARETTVMEFSQMAGIPNKIQREMGVDLTAGKVNSVAIVQKIMGAPRMEDMLKAYMEAKAKKVTYQWQRRNGYECSSVGDKRFSALFAKLPDGYTIEEHYQLGVKGWGVLGQDHWKKGKGQPPKDPSKDLWGEYKQLWSVWVDHNPTLFKELAEAAKAKGNILSDCFANTPISQARALCELLNERM